MRREFAGSTRPVVLLGGGGHAAVIADALGDRLLGYLAPEPGAEQMCGQWLGTDAEVDRLRRNGCSFAIGLGSVDRPSVERRRKIIQRIEEDWLAIVVHRSAVVADSAALAAGVFVAAGVVIGVRAVIGVGSIVNTRSSIDHDCVIGPNVHVAPGVTLSGGVTLGEDGLVGVGSSVRQGISIGPRAIVGAGAAVVADVSAGETVVGVPARPVA